MSFLSTPFIVNFIIYFSTPTGKQVGRETNRNREEVDRQTFFDQERIGKEEDDQADVPHAKSSRLKLEEESRFPDERRRRQFEQIRPIVVDLRPTVPDVCHHFRVDRRRRRKVKFLRRLFRSKEDRQTSFFTDKTGRQSAVVDEARHRTNHQQQKSRSGRRRRRKGRREVEVENARNVISGPKVFGE